MPLLAAGQEAVLAGKRRRVVFITTLVVVCMILVMGVPGAMQRLSLGLLGPVLLWVANCTLLCVDERRLPLLAV